MTFKGMLTILINDYKKQHEEKMHFMSQELTKTRQELRDVKEKLRILQLGCTRPSSSVSSSSNESSDSIPKISLFVQYNGFFNQLCDIRQTMTIQELLTKLRQITGIPFHRSIRLRVLSEDGLKTILFLDDELDRTLESYNNELKPRMIISIEDNEEHHMKIKFHRRSRSASISERTRSHESDV